MIISHEHKFVFIHNPKAAGTSLRQSLSAADSYNGWFWGFEWTRFGRVDKAHMPMWMLNQLHPHIFRHLETYTVFAMVREPLARFVSAYNEQFRNTYRVKEKAPFLSGPYGVGLNLYAQDMMRAETFRYRFRHAQRQAEMLRFGDEFHVDVAIALNAPERGLALLAERNPVAAALVTEGLGTRANSRQPQNVPRLWRSVESGLASFYRDDSDLLGRAEWGAFLR